MTRSTPGSRAFDVLAASLEVKVAVDVGDHDTAARALGKLRIALDAVLLDVAAAGLRQDLMEDAEPRRPHGRKEAQ